MARPDADPTDTPSVTTPSPDETAAAERRPTASGRTEQRRDTAGKVLLAPTWPSSRFVIPAEKKGEEDLVLLPEGTLVDQSRRDEIVRRAAAQRVDIHEVKA